MKFKLIQALIVVLIVCKNEEDPFKIESTRVVKIFLPLLVYRDFYKRSKKNELEWSQHYSLIFKMLKGS